MGATEWLLVCILSGIVVAFIFCGWSAWDLWKDRNALIKEKINGLTMIQTMAAFRLEIISLIKATAILCIFYPIAADTWGWYNPLENVSDRNRLIITRSFVVLVVLLLPGRAIWDRIDRIRSGWKLRTRRK